MGKGLVDALQGEFEIKQEWLPYEIHPDTPPEGVLLAEYFKGMDPKAFFRGLDARGKEFGVRFGPQERMSNSGQAMEAGEFAKEHGLYDVYHEAVFKAFFTECRDIGDRAVLLNLARDIGLDLDGLNTALDAGTYRPKLEETRAMAGKMGITAVPTFVLQGREKVTGVKPLETMRTILRRLEKGA